jgi:hypothetical protein
MLAGITQESLKRRKKCPWSNALAAGKMCSLSERPAKRPIVSIEPAREYFDYDELRDVAKRFNRPCDMAGLRPQIIQLRALFNKGAKIVACDLRIQNIGSCCTIFRLATPTRRRHTHCNVHKVANGYIRHDFRARHSPRRARLLSRESQNSLFVGPRLYLVAIARSS